MIRILWPLVLSLALHAQAHLFSTPVTIDLNGHWVLRVDLALKDQSGDPFRSFRFILDTGSTLCVIDQSVASEFFKNRWWRPKLKVSDINNVEVKYPRVSIHQMKVGELTQDCVEAVVMDLKRGPLGSLQDEPVDGILGMNFLKDRSFTWEPSTQSIFWGPVPIDGVKIPITYDWFGLPTMKVTMDKISFLATIDTGASDGFSIPAGIVKAKQEGTEVATGGINGPLKIEKRVQLANIEIGPLKWETTKASLVSRSEGTLGLAVFSHLRTEFNFKDHVLTLPVGTGSRVPSPVRGCSTPPTLWVRKGSASHLEIPLLAKEEQAYKAGLRQGDIVVRVNELEGLRLNRRSVRDAVRNGPTTWEVLRDMEPLTLRLEAQPCPPLSQNTSVSGCDA